MPSPGAVPTAPVVQGLPEDAFNDSKTLVVDMPIPSAARGDKR